MKESPKECALCDQEMTEVDESVHGHLHGIFPVSFCSDCYRALDRFVSEKNAEEDRNEKS